jgi:hypothetical protein
VQHSQSHKAAVEHLIAQHALYTPSFTHTIVHSSETSAIDFMAGETHMEVNPGLTNDLNCVSFSMWRCEEWSIGLGLTQLGMNSQVSRRDYAKLG